MKNLFNSLNKAGLLAILFAAVVITTQSAFTSAIAVEEYGRYNNTWLKLSDLDPEEYTYICDDTEVQPVCTALFDNTSGEPAPNAVPDSEDEVSYGVFNLIPIE